MATYRHYYRHRLEVDLFSTGGPHPQKAGAHEHWHKQETARLEKLGKQVRRHCDDVGGIGIRWDTSIHCSHCHRVWEADEETGEPYCCNAAVNEWLDAEKKKDFESAQVEEVELTEPPE